MAFLKETEALDRMRGYKHEIAKAMDKLYSTRDAIDTTCEDQDWDTTMVLCPFDEALMRMGEVLATLELWEDDMEEVK